MPDSPDQLDSGYQVLARRYRSRTFDEVVGQEPIADTLQRAIDRRRTAHAYLFCGTRGVGKTSMARIFARALNASAEDVGEDDASILRGEDLDVVEIDGASNNSVQDARDLIANASVLPARAPYKIYIIDEVHMLSTAAFNALLKTMEEPPPHVKFILCTTEPHKVLPTIQSRCQRFDFRPIPVPRIADHLREVLEAESIPAEDAAIARVARLANGSMRDGLSILERLVAAADGSIDGPLLERVLGVPPEDRVAEAVLAIGQGDVAGALRATAGLLGEGLPAERVLDGFAERFRQLLVAATCGADPEVLETAEDEAEALRTEAEGYDPAQLVHLVALCDAAAQRVRMSTVPRAIVDAVVARMAMSERYRDAATLLAGGDVEVPTTKKKSLSSSEAKRPRAGSSGGAPAPARRRTVEPAKTARPTTTVREKTSGSTSPSPKSVEPSPVEPAPESSERPTPPPVEAVDGPGAWALLEEAARSPRQRAALEDFEFERLEGEVLHLRLRPDASPGASFTMQRPQSLEQLASEAFGRRTRIVFVDRPDDSGQVPVPATDEVRAAQENPTVREAMELFDAHVVQVRRTSTDDTPVEDTSTEA
ncbi:MAG: DNA polymerase III, subunit gamma and tau [Phycisphaerae bacterium]|nr:DNA polymerase III, subunit gamma and tau [Phycisphaerae bacterium]